MKNQYKVSWSIFKRKCRDLYNIIKNSGNIDKYYYLYPVMKNGLPVAEILSRYMDIPISYESQEGCLIVDDLIDSGKTLNSFSEYDKAVLFVKNNNVGLVNYYVDLMDDWIVFPWEKENDIYDSVIRMLEYIGENPNREGLIETPKRIVNSWKELFSGYKEDPKKLIKIFGDGSCDEMVILKDIEFYSTCEHHFLPFFGKVHVGYVPNGKIIGVSKIARIIEVYARRLQVQERLTEQIAKLLFDELQAKGVMVIIEAVHFCMTSRGIKKQNSKMITSAIKGVYEEQEVRNEFLSLIKGN